MQLAYVSISNYKSITDAYKLDLSNITVLLGKNNKGKTNIIKAIILGMDILNNMSGLYKRKRIIKQLYDWHEDFPITLQNSKRLKNKETSIRMDFTLNDEELIAFQKITGSIINGDLSIYITLKEDNSISVTVPKKGKNTTAMTKKIVDISSFICDRFSIQYIPAVRSEGDAYDSIMSLVQDEFNNIDDEKYQDAIKYIKEMEKKKLESLAKRVREPLSRFIPEIRDIDLYKVYETMPRRTNRSKIAIDIDDGVKTSLSNKGDGVKSLFTIAILSQLSSKGQRMIIIDEPENHLHPEAIHFIDVVLQDLSKENQILISSHNPIFVNRNSISSNLIVDDGKVKKADKVEEIRKSLGVVCSDNLVDADYIILVEGASDKEILIKFIQEDKELLEYLNNKWLVIHDIKGTHNLKSEVYSLQRMCCNYMFVLDYDSAGREAVNKIKNELLVPSDRIRYFMKQNKKDTELEDLINPEIYKEFLLSKGIDISKSIFKNASIKWSDRIDKICTLVGIEFTKETENEIKEHISHRLIKSPIKKYFTSEGYEQVSSILNSVKNELITMKNK